MNKIRTDYDKIIRSIGEKLISQYQINTEVSAGINGPYNDQETIVRNLCHLIVITSIEIMISNRESLKNLLREMANSLDEQKNEEGLFTLRNKKTKDQCNGVIGHAWVMEAYIYLFKIFKDKEYIERAVDIYKKHQFNEKLGLWNRPSNSQLQMGVDFTLNHQLWFAAISAELYEISIDKTIRQDLDCFLKKLSKNTNISIDGLVCHSIINKNNILDTAKAHVKRGIDLVKRFYHKPSYFYKENGYHIFNVAAFARLYSVFPDCKFWKSNKFNKIIEYTNSKKLILELEKSNAQLDVSLKNEINNQFDKEVNIYGFPYNVPGFELYYIKQIFGNRINEDILSDYLTKQFELTYDFNEQTFGKRCFDKVTINYRIYEYYKAIQVRDLYI